MRRRGEGRLGPFSAPTRQRAGRITFGGRGHNASTLPTTVQHEEPARKEERKRKITKTDSTEDLGSREQLEAVAAALLKAASFQKKLERAEALNTEVQEKLHQAEKRNTDLEIKLKEQATAYERSLTTMRQRNTELESNNKRLRQENHDLASQAYIAHQELTELQKHKKKAEEKFRAAIESTMLGMEILGLDQGQASLTNTSDTSPA